MWFINRVGESDNFKCATSDGAAILDTLPKFRFSNSIGYVQFYSELVFRKL